LKRILTPLLSRTLQVAPAARCASDLRAKVLEGHAQGKRITDIAADTGLDRKEVARIREGAGIKGTPSVPATTFLQPGLKCNRRVATQLVSGKG
jgi:hypothetical protein